MFGSLRFRLPALFLLGIVLAGIVAALISLRLFQDYTHDQTLVELRREAAGLAQLYAESALQAADEGTHDREVPLPTQLLHLEADGIPVVIQPAEIVLDSGIYDFRHPASISPA